MHTCSQERAETTTRRGLADLLAHPSLGTFPDRKPYLFSDLFVCLFSLSLSRKWASIELQQHFLKGVTANTSTWGLHMTER